MLEDRFLRLVIDFHFRLGVCNRLCSASVCGNIRVRLSNRRRNRIDKVNSSNGCNFSIEISSSGIGDWLGNSALIDAFKVIEFQFITGLAVFRFSELEVLTIVGLIARNDALIRCYCGDILTNVVRGLQAPCHVIQRLGILLGQVGCIEASKVITDSHGGKGRIGFLIKARLKKRCGRCDASALVIRKLRVRPPLICIKRRHGFGDFGDIHIKRIDIKVIDVDFIHFEFFDFDAHIVNVLHIHGHCGHV